MLTACCFSNEIINKESFKEVSKLRRYSSQIIAVFVKNVLLLVYGSSMGMPTLLIPNLGGDIPGESIVLSENGISWVGSLNYLTVPLGCLASAFITQPIGRIKLMQATCFGLFCAFLLYHFASQPWQVFLALFLTGLSGGLLEAPGTIYTIETTEPSLRGALATTTSLFMVVGIITSFILGTLFSWRTIALINACVPLVELVILLFIPESPYWLITKGRDQEAKRSLAWLRGWTNIESVEQEFSSIYSHVKEHEIGTNVEKHFFRFDTLQLYFKSNFVKPFLLINLTFIIAGFGMTPINIYAVKIIDFLQSPVDAYVATVVIGISELIGCVVLLFFIRLLGKRKVSFISLIGVCIFSFLAGLHSYNIGACYFDSPNSIATDVAQKYNWLPLTTISFMGFFSYLITISLPWIIMGELFPNNLRDNGSGLCAATGYIICFLANKSFLSLVHLITLPGIFWFYSSIALVGLFLMYFLLPETEGKTLFEINKLYTESREFDSSHSKSNTMVQVNARQ